MKSAAAFLALVLSACAATPARQAREGPTQLGQRDLDTLVSFFTGNWDARPDEPPMRMRVVEVWKGSFVRWVYLEWVGIGEEAKPTRQLMLRIAEDGREHYMTATVHRLPGDAVRYAGEWHKPEPFAALRPGDLREIEGCRLATLRTMTAHFTLITEGDKCPGDVPGSAFMRFEFSLSSSELELLEQPRDTAGNVPVNSRLAPIKYGRMSREPR